MQLSKLNLSGARLYGDVYSPVPDEVNMLADVSDLAGGSWIDNATASATGDMADLPVVGDSISQTTAEVFSTSDVYTFSADFRGTQGQTTRLQIAAGFLPAFLPVVLTANWARWGLVATATAPGVSIVASVARAVGDTAASFRVRNLRLNAGTRIIF